MTSAICRISPGVTLQRETLYEEYVRFGRSLDSFFNTHSPEESFEIIKFLFESKIDIDVPDGMCTPLHYACRYGYIAIVSYLLKSGVDRNAVFKGPETFWSGLQLAAHKGFYSIVKIFMEEKELLNDFSLDSVLSLAVINRDLVMVSFLIERGLNVNEINNKGNSTPLILACFKGYLAIVTLLLNKGASIDLCCEKIGINALMAAVEKEYIDIARLLLERKADPNRINFVTKQTPLWIAFNTDNLAMIQLLISFGANINYLHPEHATLLHSYIEEDDVAKAELLIDLGSDMLAFDKSGFAPIHYACSFGGIEIVKLFLDRGVDPNFPTKNKDWDLPIEIASGAGCLGIVELLWERGALMEWSHLITILDKHSGKISVRDTEMWFDRLFERHKDPNVLITNVFEFPLPLISVLHLGSQFGPASAHYSALYRRLLTKEGLIIPELIFNKTVRSIKLEDLDGELRDSLRLMSRWDRYNKNLWKLPLEEIEHIKSIKNQCKTISINDESKINYNKLVQIYDLWVARHPLLSYLQLASRNFRELTADEAITINPSIFIVASLFNPYKLAAVEEVERYIRTSIPNRKKVWQYLRKQVIDNAMQIAEPKELTFIHGTTSATIPGLKKRGALLPLGLLLKDDIPFAGELCGTHREMNKEHISGITFSSTGSLLQPQYYGLTTGVNVLEFYAKGLAAKHFKRELFAAEKAFTDITAALLEDLNQIEVDFLSIQIKRLKKLGHGDDLRMIELLERITSLPVNPHFEQLVKAIMDPVVELTPKEKSYIDSRVPVAFASSLARPHVRPMERLESLEFHSLPIKKINYAFTNSEQIPFLREALSGMGIRVESFETLKLLSLFCMARGTWVENKISELTPTIGKAQADVAAILEGYILPNYAKLFPERPSYVDRLGVRREIDVPYFGDGIISYEHYVAQVNLQATLPRNIHGLMHAVRVAIAAQLINNLLGLDELPAWIIAACAAHDMGREDEAEDFWDEKSSDLFSAIMFIATQGSAQTAAYGKIIANKDTQEPCYKTLPVQILHDADVLEIHRIYLSSPEAFDKRHLYFLTNEKIPKPDGEAINLEWREFIRLTEEPELKFRLEFQGDSYYLEVMKLLAKFVSEGKFPTIGRFLDKEIRACDNWRLGEL